MEAAGTATAAATGDAAAPRGPRPIVLDVDEVADEATTLGPGTVVQLTNLTQTPQLNGTLAHVVQFRADKNRWEVVLHPGKEKRAVLRTNLTTLSVLDEVLVLRECLANEGTRASVVRTVFARLGELSITPEVIVDTKIGRIVNDVGKAFTLDDVNELSRRLVSRWREEFRHAKAAEAASKDPVPSPASPPPVPAKRARVTSGAVLDQQPASAPAVVLVQPADELSVEDTAHSQQEQVPPVVVDVELLVQEDETALLGRPGGRLQCRDLQGLVQEAAYLEMIQNDDVLREYLLKQKSVLKNLTPETVAFCRHHVTTNSRSEKLMNAAGNARPAIRISGLPPDATELDLERLLHGHGFGPAEVCVAIESRFRRSCGVAFVTLPSRAAAEEAIHRLSAIAISGHQLRAEWAGRLPDKPARVGKQLSWKSGEDLYQIGLFDKSESVQSFADDIQNHTMPTVDSAMPEVETQEKLQHAELFRRATAREHAEEARHARETADEVAAGGLPE